MSLKDRFVDGVGSLFERLSDGDDLSGVSPAALERELGARKAARKAAGTPSPFDNPLARMAAGGDKARSERAAKSAKRVKTIHARKAESSASQKRASDEAFRRMNEEARRYQSQSGVPPRSGASSSRSGQSRVPPIFQKKDLAAHYKTLELEYGADQSEVKKAYRSLMRKYHPDRHTDESKKKAATQLAVKISAAYEAIEKSRK